MREERFKMERPGLVEEDVYKRQLQMIHSFLRCAVGTGCINDIFSTTAVPWDQRSVRFREHRNLLTIDDQTLLICVKLPLDCLLYTSSEWQAVYICMEGEY